MGGALFSIGEVVRITGGPFVDHEGVVVSPTIAVGSSGTVALAGSSGPPVTVATMIDGH